MAKFLVGEGVGEGERLEIINPGHAPVAALARELTTDDLPTSADLPEDTLFGRASGAGTGPATPLTVSQVAEIRRFPVIVTEAVGGAFNNFVLGEVDTWRFTANAVISGVVPPPPTLGREFAIENAAAVGSGIAVTILQESGLSSTAQRFNLPEGVAQFVLQPSQLVRFRYVTGNRWRVIGVGGQLLGNNSVGAAQLNGGVLSALTSTSPTATAANTALGLASHAIPANFLVVGHTYRSCLYYTFVHTAAATPTITLEMIIGAAFGITLPVAVLSTAGTYQGFVEAVWRFTAVGAAGNVILSLRSVNPMGFAVADFLAAANVPVFAVDTTLATAVQLRVRMTTAVAGNTLTVNQAILERLINV
jgi:hypothetical protein